MSKKYDVGIIGLWYGRNYGSMVTYYALHSVITDMGYSVLMINNPLGNANFEITKTHPFRIANMYYNVSERLRLDSLSKLNDVCDTFVVGSDQLWNYGLSRPYKQMYFLGFADDSKKKIAYGTSFGRAYNAPEDEKVRSGGNLARFDGISVRDDLSLSTCKNTFALNDTVEVCDPTFLCKIEAYNELASKAGTLETEPYILAYVLDPNPEIGRQLEKLSIEKNMKVVVLLDEPPVRWDANFANLQLSGNGRVEVKKDVDLFEWLWYYQNSSCVFTDSFHGTIFSIIFKKPFVSLINRKRGAERFVSLLKPIDLEYRLIDSADKITSDLSKYDSCDYEGPYQKLNAIKEYSYNWLKDQLTKEKKMIPANAEVKSITPAPAMQPKPVIEEKPKTSVDFERCKMIVTLVKRYGIKHIVMSSGSRNLNLARLFEAEPYFKIYRVTDERSAGFYALGIAARLGEPVVMCCTSGTATSNYLTSITEAYYQHIPLVVITGDRYPRYLGQDEEQTIPQAGMYGKVVKKCVSLPQDPTVLGDWEARRMVCEALLEVKHHGTGPVHINVPIANIEFPKPPASVLKLDKKYLCIDRFELCDPDSKWQDKVDRLSKVKRILVVYCQNQPLSIEEQKSVEAFVDKFNCVVISDNLANFHCSKSILSYNITHDYTQKQFRDELAPDIVITVGGRRMLNNPILGKLRNLGTQWYHWRVAEDGEVADTYRRLKNVFECSQKYFFDYFVEHSGDIHNDGEYYKAWKKAESNIKVMHAEKYNQLYAIERTVTTLPAHSLLHIGIGHTIIMTNRYKLDPTVRVFCNMGTNGIDGSASTFMGHCAVSKELCFLMIGDLSFFYDMNSIWNKPLTGNIRIMMFNNSGAGLLRHYRSPSITQKHETSAKAWVKSVGFNYLSSENQEEFEENLKIFTSDCDQPIFFEVFC